MTHRSSNTLSALAALAVLIWPLPRLLASDCACPKPKVKITAIHSFSPPEAVTVKIDGAALPPAPEPVEMERDRAYALTVEIDASKVSIACDTTIGLDFPHCTIEYSRDNGTTWIRGSRTWITAMDQGDYFTYSPTAVLIRITSPPSDSAANTPAPGSAATAQSTPPAYAYDASNQTTVPTPPGLGLEIPLGAAFMPGWLPLGGVARQLWPGG